MKRYASLKNVGARVEQRSRARRDVDAITLVTLAVAALASGASLVQAILLWQQLKSLDVQVDATYKAQAYQEQVNRTVVAVDFMTDLRASENKWQSKFEDKAFERSDSQEIRQKEVDFAMLAERSWLLPNELRPLIVEAAESYNDYASQCMLPFYESNTAMPDKCERLAERHAKTLETAVAKVSVAAAFGYPSKGAVKGAGQ